MKFIQGLRRVACCCVLALLLCGLWTGTAADAASTGSITVTFPIDGTSFRVYRVADFINGSYVMDAAYPGIDPVADPAVAASKIRDIIKNNAITPADTQTIRGGSCLFSGLSMGLYLVEGDSFELNDITYWPVPSLCSVPQNEQGILKWDVTVSNKYDKAMKIRAQKLWINDSKESRPVSVQVQLYRNGIPYGNPVTLNEGNGWKCIWRDLPADGAEWTVDEVNVPENYWKQVKHEDGWWYIYNYRTIPRLPQTGQLWWPVALLASCGVVFMTAAILVNRKRDDNE